MQDTLPVDETVVTPEESLKATIENGGWRYSADELKDLKIDGKQDIRKIIEIYNRDEIFETYSNENQKRIVGAVERHRQEIVGIKKKELELPELETKRLVIDRDRWKAILETRLIKRQLAQLDQQEAQEMQEYQQRLAELQAEADSAEAALPDEAAVDAAAVGTDEVPAI